MTPLAQTRSAVPRGCPANQGPDRRTGQCPSNRWRRANDRRNKVHDGVSNLRCDGIHKLTTSLAREYGTVVVEDLAVAGMLKNAGWPVWSRMPGSGRSAAS
jgi:hypothetical protein